ncbi:hypothetical protein [Xanthomonas theicola]|uniref:Uncharacterized protein n=1 Tax=Xanthomonas theicola TaxID=56464 RepID=A0A2S6ZGI2_9XANT|nr:hypothetical protein [Xanthomonas theicola]PPT91371.1 hypothetical protein XthCFBP4691_08015 [Xanthomonas theicola]QNH24408.1 hypothetical protein G4Q83_06055 [Xanthomonas theicola]
MLLRTLFQRLGGIRRPDRAHVTLMAALEAGQLKAFREFTPPPRRQGGSVMRLGQRAGDRLDRIAIVPFAGVKVP